ncbi:alpha-glucosidase 2 [Colletotrichum spaethianum]|uniref:alpha-glucosidase n=1 Tax=Colletotrichum spaethianum TaxID=700344 RepID=A0AA37NVU3_9PEZI|nr:alpha-glucosidase 2 [Colletotrichum spaethianum]GKT40625.1 alpha-glucosidase 2 [Colletotrichum spaethianum]
MNGIPTHRNVTGLMLDNYSQVAIDLGTNESNTIGIATRFGTFDAYVMTADDVPKMIWLVNYLRLCRVVADSYRQYTSIVGRPKLKPRFILGHHQGCYGYNKSATVEGIVDGYRTSGIPLDGMHLDVDFQDRYRTFTASESKFGNIGNFLNGLRQKGVKCCTNITPILSLRESDADPYINLRNFWDEGDKLNPATKYLKGLPDNQQRGWRYDGGGFAVPTQLDPANPDIQKIYTDSVDEPENALRDNYNFNENYNSGYPFHGGVSYGTLPGTNTNLGTAGYYPDLNRTVAREKWGEQYQYLFDNGLEFVWQDMTTPAVAEVYGDMLGFPSRLLMSDDTPNQDPKVKPPTKTAIELWGLYSYNLHKATYKGLNQLKGRENKRNFIIGRGSLTGMHRFAGLWTGDNGSSWDFWRISVAQVIALGYSGITIAGVDMGGFTPDPDKELNPPQWCDPELLIRWYTGAFLLPWYRNHYIQHFGGKDFQNYPQALQGSSQDVYNLYMSVEPICRYYVQLRYSLLQVLYDTMFANLIDGLPIARAMVRHMFLLRPLNKIVH